MYNLDYLNKISDHDEKFIREIIKTFIENGLELVEAIDELSEKEKFEQLSRMVHKFIPSLNFIGVKEFKPDLNVLEVDLLKMEDKDQVLETLETSKINVLELIALLQSDFEL